MDNIRGYIRARKFHEYEYEYAKFSWIISMESPKQGVQGSLPETLPQPGSVTWRGS